MNKNSEDKEKILNAWIMVEYLSEGDIGDNEGLKLEIPADKDFYSFFKESVDQDLKNNQKEGIVVYFNIFKFKKIFSILNLQKTEEDISLGSKFSFALYFDKKLKLAENMTFFTASYYILDKKEIPNFQNFRKYEEENKNCIAELFKVSENENENYQQRFNQAFDKLIRKYSVNLANSKMKVVKNLESAAKNLHSFFVNDLEKARSVNSENLDKYLFGAKDVERLNLDSKDATAKKVFWNILQPKNYPMSRFPSNLDHPLSFMQQVAVNLAIGYDNEQMRSVNGPPGTGKTTLLKDIFAELVVKQAYEITNLKSKKISDTIEFSKDKKIGKLPERIANKGIVVASSNNGAVQNIVNELPQKNKIDKDFIKALEAVDYFKCISNVKISEKWEEDENGKKSRSVEVQEGEELFWGLFSLEGGKKENVKNMILALECVAKELKEKYPSNDKVYDEFKEQYDALLSFKQGIQVVSDLKILENRKISIAEEIKALDETIGINQKQQHLLSQNIEGLKLQKPSIFSMLFNKEVWKNYKIQRKEFLDKLRDLSDEKTHLLNNKNNLKNEEISVLQQIKLMEEKIEPKSVQILDMDKDYEALQLSNPWFEREYRVLQSNLFIAALKVRKQFLFENIESLKAAYILWNKQKEYLNHKQAIEQAWNWLNMVIPVIGSTFASIHTMCENLGEGTIGYLFIDEAGQALPQASVGAIFRSKQVMVVGDPAQIKPVLTLDSSVLGKLRETYAISDKYLSSDSSTQTLVDESSKYGFYKEQDKWIGIPLWVHRRCKNPMFHISNAISYGGNMVQGTKEADTGKAIWYDIGDIAEDKYVEKQGDFLKEEIQKLLEENWSNQAIYVISPFKNVANKLTEKLKEIKFTKYENGKPTNIGTVHTFQGKEAPIVFLVLGCDEKSKGAASWAMGTENPNIMNVAVTRAQQKFYIIGDIKLYKKLKSKVIDETIERVERVTPVLSTDCVMLENFQQ